MTKLFNPMEWIEMPIPQATNTEPALNIIPNEDEVLFNEVKEIIDEIETKKIDITSDYAEWRKIGRAHV